MSYANLIGIACADRTEYFCRMRDFLCKRNGTYDYSASGIGWTLHDSVYAVDEDNPATNDYYVIFSPGEGGKDDLYYKIIWMAAAIRIDMFQSWDASTHAGANTSAGNNQLDQVSGFSLWVYGDLDMFCIINKVVAGDYDGWIGGKAVPNWDGQSGEIVNCAGALTAGSDVSITVDSMPTEWAVGKDIYIRTTHNDAMATVKVEMCTIKTLVGLVITADLLNDYTADSALSNHLCYHMQQPKYMSSTTYCFTGKKTAPGWVNSTANPIRLSLTTGSFDPSMQDARTFLSKLHMQGIDGYFGYQKNIRFTVTIPTSGYITDEDILEEEDGTQWRVFGIYSGYYIGMKEV